MLRGYDPVREEAHWTLIGSGLIIGVFTVTIGFVHAQLLGDPELLIEGQFSTSVYTILFVLSLIYLLIIWIISFLRLRRRLARTRHLRQMVMEGSAPLCAPPSQEALPITLPYTIRMHIGQDFLKRCRAIGVIGGVFTIGLFIIYRNLPLAENLHFLLLRFIPLLTILAILISALVRTRYAAPRLTIDENTITAHYLGDHVTMCWDRVRCFMITDQDKPGSAWAFELSDGENILRWVDISVKQANNPYAPLMQPSQYAALMQTLPHWICT